MAVMRLTAPTKTVLAMVLVLALAAYLLLVEFAVNAGRVHHGVDVQGVDVGGLNHAEAQDVLTQRGEEMKASPMIFSTEGFDCRFTPEDVGWGPQAFDTAAAAMAVGREGGILQALRDRWRAWTEGVTIDWGGSPDPARVTRELNRCEQIAEGLGIEIDRPRLRYKIKRAIVAWPRAIFTIPLASEAS